MGVAFEQYWKMWSRSLIVYGHAIVAIGVWCEASPYLSLCSHIYAYFTMNKPFVDDPQHVPSISSSSDLIMIVASCIQSPSSSPLILGIYWF